MELLCAVAGEEEDSTGAVQLLEEGSIDLVKLTCPEHLASLSEEQVCGRGVGVRCALGALL